jgi:hypothetical protein
LAVWAVVLIAVSEPFPEGGDNPGVNSAASPQAGRGGVCARRAGG